MGNLDWRVIEHIFQVCPSLRRIVNEIGGWSQMVEWVCVVYLFLTYRAFLYCIFDLLGAVMNQIKPEDEEQDGGGRHSSYPTHMYLDTPEFESRTALSYSSPYALTSAVTGRTPVLYNQAFQTKYRG